MVVVGGALLYGLPDVWSRYSSRFYPIILPYILPIVQVLYHDHLYFIKITSPVVDVIKYFWRKTRFPPKLKQQ